MARVNITAVLEKILGTSQIQSEEQLDELIQTLKDSDEELLSAQELAELMEKMKK